MKLSVLSQGELEQIHHSALRILSEVGISLDDSEACTLLLDNKAREENGRICLPPDLVNECLGRPPSQVTIEGRGGRVILGDGGLYVHNLGGARDVVDRPGGKPRPATAKDVAESARLLDALDNVDTVTPLYTPRDAPPGAMALTMFEQTVHNTLKPFNGPGISTVQDVRSISEMARVVFGDHPQITLDVSPVSPLNFQGHIAPSIMEIARQGLPFGPLPCPIVGATSPMSLAGSLAQQNAENLAAIVLAQLVHPGLPIVYCGRLSILDMRSGVASWGSPEMGVMAAATVQIGHFYNLPVNVYGLSDSSYAADMQAGYQRALGAVVPAVAGADELSGVGEMAGGPFSSNFQIVIDDDIYGMVRQIRRGVHVDEDSLAVEVIAKAMHTKGNFLGQKHTRDYMHAGEVWRGRFANLETKWEAWESAGGRDVLSRAQEESERILAEHQVPPLPEDQSKALDEILRHSVPS